MIESQVKGNAGLQKPAGFPCICFLNLMSSQSGNLWLYALLLAAGAAVLVRLIHAVGTDDLAFHLTQLGAWIPLLLFIALPAHLINTAGLRFCIPRSVPRPSWRRLVVARMAGEAINNTTPSAYLGGEPIKAKILQTSLGGVQATATVVLAKTIQTLTEMVFIVGGSILALHLLNVPDGFAAGMGIVIGSGAVIVIALAFQQQRGLFSGPFELLGRFSFLDRFVEIHLHGVRRLDERIAEFYRESRYYFSLSFGLHFIGWMMGAVESYLMLRALGANVDFQMALVIESVLLIAQGVLFFMPGSLGMTESAAYYVAIWAGLESDIGLMLGLLKRMRMVFWSIAGWALFALAIKAMRNEKAQAADPADSESANTAID